MAKIFTFLRCGSGRNKTVSLIAAISIFQFAEAQKTEVVDSLGRYLRVVKAGAEYQRSGLHQWLWGKDYRKEWTTPVTVPVLNLDSAYGGLTPIKMGGGRQTKSLRLKDATGRVWVLRSVNKTYLGALPEIVQGTFIEDLANDQIATNHPYAALTVPRMAEAAGVYHTNPKYYLVPYSSRLGEYNEIFANTLCMLEERPDETQTSTKSFGPAEDLMSTEDMLEKIEGKNDHVMDQHSYIKTRLFDMFLGDWGRHKDNWRWGKYDSGSFKVYRPVPKDRDQTWAKFEGTLLRLVAIAGKFKELQSFEGDIKNLAWYNSPGFSLDKRFTNDLSRQDWINAAKELKAEMTDEVIEAAVHDMPAEIFAIRGQETIDKLKSRRDKLEKYANEYYAFMAKEVEIPGTKESESFEVNRLNDNETEVKVYRIGKDGDKKKHPVFSRVFLNDETKELRLYGVGGNDNFHVEGVVEKGIKIRIIGGPEKDSISDISYVGGWGHKTKVYDNPGNNITTSAETKVHLSKYPSINRYEYDVFKYDSRGVKPVFYYNTFYRFYVGLAYGVTKNRAKDGSYTSKHAVGINYSLIENSFHPYYNGTFKELLGHWNVNLSGGYDQVRRFNYFGTGNETVAANSDISYYYLRLKTFYGSAGIDQTFLKYHNVRLDFQYSANKVYDTEGRFVSRKNGVVDPSTFDWKQFGGAQLTYSYVNTNDPVVPTGGVNFQVAGSYTQNLKESSRRVYRGTTALNVYIPLLKPFSLAIKSGASTLGGTPEFYQLNNIGGFYTLRGFWRYRFYGTTAVFNQNELRWLPEVHGHLFSGRIGLVAFFDQGRVWQEGDQSNKWHYGYGGGAILVPFNKISLAVTYGFSDEGRRMNIRIGHFL